MSRHAEDGSCCEGSSKTCAQWAEKERKADQAATPPSSEDMEAADKRFRAGRSRH